MQSKQLLLESPEGTDLAMSVLFDCDFLVIFCLHPSSFLTSCLCAFLVSAVRAVFAAHYPHLNVALRTVLG
jgi:hypothetical protein